MSRLLEKIKECTRAEAQPMGFRVARKAARLCPILIARLAATGIKDLKERLAGADAVIVPASAQAAREIKEAAAGIVWGAWLDGEMDEVSEGGGDFVVFRAEETPLTLLENVDISKVLLADVSAEGGLLRAVSGVPADAVLASGEALDGPSLTWQKLLYLQRLADFIKQPLLAPVPLNANGDELKVLWGSGVVGMVAEINGQEPVGSLGKLRKLVDATDFIISKKEKGSAVLPRLAAEPEKAEAVPTEVPEIEPEEGD